MEKHIKRLQTALSSSSPDKKSSSQRFLFHALFSAWRALRDDVATTNEENRTKMINLLNSLTCPPQLQLCTIAAARIIPQCYFLLSEPKSTLKTAKRLQRSITTSNDDQTLLISTIVLGGILKHFGRKFGRGGNFLVEIVDMLKNSKFIKHSNPSFREALMKCLTDCVLGTGIAPSREVHANTIKILSKFASDKVPEVRVRVAECVAAVASSSAGFNTISIVPMLTLCLKYLGDEFPRVRLAFAVTTGTLIATSVSLVSQDQDSNSNSPKSSRSKTSWLGKIKIPKSFTFDSGLEFLASQFDRASTHRHREGFLFALNYFLQATIHLDTFSCVVMLKHVTSILLSTSKFDGAEAVSRVIRKGFTFHATRSRLIEFVKASIHVLVGLEPQRDVAGVVSSCLLHELHHQILVLRGDVSIVSILKELRSAVDFMLQSPYHRTRVEAARCLHGMCVSIPNKSSSILQNMSNSLMSTHAEFSSSDRGWSFRLQGQAAALSAILCVGLSSRDGFPEQEIGVALAVARALVARQHDSTLDRETNLVCTRSGWNVVSALVSLGPSYCGVHLLELLPMWKMAMKIRKDRDAESNAKYLIFATSAMARFAESCGELLRDRRDLCERMVEMLVSPLTLLVSESGKKNSNDSKVMGWLRTVVMETYCAIPCECFESQVKELLIMSCQVFCDDLIGRTSLYREFLSKHEFVLELCENQSTLLQDHAAHPDSYGISILEQLERCAPSKIGVELTEIRNLQHLTSSTFSRTPPRDLETCTTNVAIRLFGKLFPVYEECRSLIVHFVRALQSRLGEERTEERAVLATNLCTAICLCASSSSSRSKTDSKSSWREPAKKLLLAALASTNLCVQRVAARALAILTRDEASAEMRAKTCKSLELAAQRSRHKNLNAVSGAAHAIVSVRRILGASKFEALNIRDAVMLFDIARETRQPVRTWVLHSWSVMLQYSGAEFERHQTSSLALAEAHMLALSAPSSTCNLSSLSVAVCVGKIVGSIARSSMSKELAQKLFAIAEALSKYALPSPEPNRVVVLEWLRCVERLCEFAPPEITKDVSRRLVNEILRDDIVELGFRPFSESASWETQRVAVRCLEKSMNIEMIRELELELEFVELYDRTVTRRADVKDLERVLKTMLKMGIEKDKRRLFVWIAILEKFLGESGGVTKKEKKKTFGEDDEEEDDEDDFISTELCGKNTFSSKERERMRDVSERVWIRCGGSVYASTKCLLLERFVELVRMCKDERDPKILERIVNIVTCGAQSSVEIVRVYAMRAMNEVVMVFGSVEDPEVKGISCLQQYEAQIGMVVKTAFGSDNPRLTIRACETMTSLIRLGVSRDPVAVKRMIGKLLPKLSIEEFAKREKKCAEHVEIEILLTKLKALSILYLVMSETLRPFWIAAVHDRMQLVRGARTLMLIGADVITEEVEIAYEGMWKDLALASCVSGVKNKDDKTLLMGAAASVKHTLMLAMLYNEDEEEDEDKDVQMEMLELCAKDKRALRIVLEKMKRSDEDVLRLVCEACCSFHDDVDMFRVGVRTVKMSKDCSAAMLLVALKMAWTKEDSSFVRVYVEEHRDDDDDSKLITNTDMNLAEGRDSNIFWEVMTILGNSDENIIMEMWIEDAKKRKRGVIEYLKSLKNDVLREQWMMSSEVISEVISIVTDKNRLERSNALIVLSRTIRDEEKLMNILVKLTLNDRDLKSTGIKLLIEMAKNTQQRDAFKKCISNLRPNERNKIQSMMKKVMMSAKKKSGGGKKKRKKRVLELKGF